MDFSQVIQALDEARDGFDLWYAFIIGLPALAGVFATLLVTLSGQKKAKQRWREQSEKADMTLFQVKNDHTENLRDEISNGFNRVMRDISSLREELDTERRERIEGDLKEYW